jgi:hypothetical protein
MGNIPSIIGEKELRTTGNEIRADNKKGMLKDEQIHYENLTFM